MFDGLVRRYDLVNDVLSLGLDRRWRGASAAALRVPPGRPVLDLGCGTGKLGALLAARYKVVGLDVSGGMLARARSSGSRLLLAQGSAFRLPFREGSFSGVASAFVLRNLNDLEVAFGELGRVVAPGGGLSLLDITEPSHPLIRRLFDAYFRRAAPAVGSLIGRRGEYRYLVRSLSHLPRTEEMCAMLRRAGFRNCAARPLTGGVVTLFTAERGGARTIGELPSF
jgi:demethylmenaquinone methyltransferase / 2-methoxy-6-polyprenyl-1,4-benzoquinol methylase